VYSSYPYSSYSYCPSNSYYGGGYVRPGVSLSFGNFGLYLRP
jgi:hypothetical protein